MGRFPRIKKDAISQAVKLTQPVLKLLNEDSSEAVWVSKNFLKTCLLFLTLSIYWLKMTKNSNSPLSLMSFTEQAS